MDVLAKLVFAAASFDSRTGDGATASALTDLAHSRIEWSGSNRKRSRQRGSGRDH